MRQEKLEKEMSQLKENTLKEEEVVRMVELKCAKLRQENFPCKFVFFAKLQHYNHHTIREELEGRMLGLEEGKTRGGGTNEDWKQVNLLLLDKFEFFNKLDKFELFDTLEKFELSFQSVLNSPR